MLPKTILVALEYIKLAHKKKIIIAERHKMYLSIRLQLGQCVWLHFYEVTDHPCSFGAQCLNSVSYCLSIGVVKCHKYVTN